MEMSDYDDMSAACDEEAMDSENNSDPALVRLSYAMDLSSSLPEEPLQSAPIHGTDSYVNALSTLQGAKALLLSTADARTGLNKLQKENTELEQALEDQTNIQNLNDIQQMRKFYDDVTTGSARVDARIRAIESVQWLDLDDKYGIRRQNLLGESRNMRAIEEKAMRSNAMAALRHYLGEFQVKKIKNQLESADSWFGAQEKRLKEEILSLNPDGTSSAAEAQRMDLIEAALAHENIDPNLSKVFSERGNGLADATARIYKSFALWVGRAKQQLEQTKLESAAASKHLKSRLLSTEAEGSYLRARVAELEASVATSGADEVGIKADIAAKYISTRNSLQEQISQLRDRIEDVRETIAQDKEEIAGAKKMASSLRNYDPLKLVDDSSKDIDDRESIFKDYMRQLTTKDNAANDRLQKQIDRKIESLKALATTETEVKERIAAAQSCSRTSVIALDKHKMKAAADRNALEIMFKALTGKKESLDKKIARAEERAAVKTRSVQIKDKNTAVLKNLSGGNNRRTVHAGSADGSKHRVTPGHRNSTMSKPSASSHRQHRSSTRAVASAVLSTIHDSKTTEEATRRRRSSASQRRGSLRRDSSNDSCSSDDAARSGRRKSITSTGLAASTVQGSNANLTTSLPLAARRNSKELRRPSIDNPSVKPRPPSEDSGRKNSFRGRVANAPIDSGVSIAMKPPDRDRTNKPHLYVNANSGATTLSANESLDTHIDATMEPIAEYEEEQEVEEELESYTCCGKSQSTLLAGVYSYFIVELRLTKLEKDIPQAAEEEISPPTPDTYKKKFESIKSALPKDVYYINKRKAAPMRRRMFSSDDIEGEALAENPLVKYLVIDDSYRMTYDFSEAMITVNRCVGLLQSLGYLDQPTIGNNALCNLYSYFNVEFLLDDFEEPSSRLKRAVYSFATDSSVKIWRRYQESLQAIRYQDNFQKEDELRRFCITIVKYSVDNFIKIIDGEQKYLKSDYSLTVRETDTNVWLRMAEVLNVIFGCLAVVVNCTFETEFENPDHCDNEDAAQADGIDTLSLQAVSPPPPECGLGPSMNVYLNRAGEHVYSAICMANGLSGKTEAAHSATKHVGADLAVVHTIPAVAVPCSGDNHTENEGDTMKVLGQDDYPLSFVRTIGFFFTLYRAAFMTSMVNKKTHSPFFSLLYEWILSYFPNHWKESWVSHPEKKHLKKLLLRDVQILRAFSSYFYFTGLGVDVMDLEEAEKSFKSELEALSGCSDISSTSVVDGGSLDDTMNPDTDSPAKAPRGSISYRSGICCHDLPWNALISLVVPPALPVLTVLRMILKFSFKKIKILGVSSIDTIEFKQECQRMFSFHNDHSGPGSPNLSEFESIVVEKLIPTAQKSTYIQLDGLCGELLQEIDYQIRNYESKLNIHEESLTIGGSSLGEEGFEMDSTADRPSPSHVNGAHMSSGATDGEPYIKHGDLRILDLPYGLLTNLNSILSELQELSRSIAKGTKTLAHMVAIRVQSLLESFHSVMSSIKVHRKKAEAWLERKKHDAELHDLVSSNRRAIIGVCEALLDACGVSIDHALVSTQVEKAELSCERIRSARRKIKFSKVCNDKPESVNEPAVTGESTDTQCSTELDAVKSRTFDDSRGDAATTLDALKAAVQYLRSNVHPDIQEKLMENKKVTPTDRREEVPVDLTSEDDMTQCKAYLTEQMSMALVQHSHWKREWDEVLEEEERKQRRNVEHAMSTGKSDISGDSDELHDNIRTDSNKDILLSDILGVSGGCNETDDQASEPSILRGNSENIEDGVVPGMQWSLTRGVLKPGKDVFAGSTA